MKLKVGQKVEIPSPNKLDDQWKESFSGIVIEIDEEFEPPYVMVENKDGNQFSIDINRLEKFFLKEKIRKL